ncbi:hypothetical protein [Rhodococcus sp. NBC_00294]|uniref:hypothetical protein n=1 Tax=Rhodococcus sp. NBC_00294 TaxID=2976004 RepID=UPI002E2E0F7C|nr:hypothetical protein [Rhodococcus sp. NBC_00294]
MRLVKLLLPGLLLVVIPNASCGAPAPADQRALSSTELDVIDRDTVGAVVVGPAQFPFDSASDVTRLMTFDANGNLLGSITGGALLNAQVDGLDNRLVTANADQLISVSNTHKTATPIKKQVVESSIQDEGRTRTATWFNDGRQGSTTTTTYWSTEHTGQQTTGTIQGMALASAFCGASIYALVEDIDSLSWNKPTQNWLYRIETNGTRTEVATWEADPSVRPASRQAVCSADGTSMTVLYASRQGTPAGSLPTLQQWVFNLQDGSIDKRVLLEANDEWRIHANGVASSKERLYWINSSGSVYSISSSSLLEPAKLEWKVPHTGPRTRLSIHGGRVQVLDYANHPTLHEFELASGRKTRESISLPWLSPIIDSPTASGQSTNTVTDLLVQG